MTRQKWIGTAFILILLLIFCSPAAFAGKGKSSVADLAATKDGNGPSPVADLAQTKDDNGPNPVADLARGKKHQNGKDDEPSVADLARDKVALLTDSALTYKDYEKVMVDILALGPEAAGGLVSFLEEPAPANPDTAEGQHDWNARVGVMNILAEFKAEEAVPVLANMLETGDRGSAIVNSGRTLGRIGGAAAFGALSKVLANANNNQYPDNENRKKAAVMGLGLCKDPRAIPALKEVMDNPANAMKLRVYAAGSMGYLGDPSGMDLAAQATASNDGYVKMAGIRTIGMIGLEAGYQYIMAFFRPDVSGNFRQAAELAYGQIYYANMAEDQKVPVMKETLKMFSRSTPFIQWGTLMLKEVNTPEARAAMEELAALTDPQYSTLAAAAKMRLQTMN